MATKEAPGQEYRDPPPPVSAKGVNSLALWIERIARNWADQPARQKAPLTPGRRVVTGAIGVVVLGTIVEIINLSRGSRSVPEYVGSKAQQAQNVITSLGPEQSRPATPDYLGSKDEIQEFKPEGPRTGRRDNIFVTNLTKAKFTVNYNNLARLMVDPKLPEPVTPNYIVSLAIATQDLPSSAERTAFYDMIENDPAFKTAKADYYQSAKIPKQNQLVLELFFSLSEQIKKLAPTSQEFQALSTDQVLFNISYTLSFLALRTCQKAMADVRGKSAQALTDLQIDAQFSDQLRQALPIIITYIDPLLIQSIYQESPKG